MSLTSQRLARVKASCKYAAEAKRLDLGKIILDLEHWPYGSVELLTNRDNGNVWRLRLGQVE